MVLGTALAVSVWKAKPLEEVGLGISNRQSERPMVTDRIVVSL